MDFGLIFIYVFLLTIAIAGVVYAKIEDKKAKQKL